MKKPTVGSLFAGIGGFDLGFERAGFDVQWQVEIDPWCRKVLAKHWPNVRRHDDVKTFPPTGAGDWRVDCIIGGFPCQDISIAGRGEGISGSRSGLWCEYARIIRVVRPLFAVVENVPALLHRGMDAVLGDLATLGYDAEWDCIPAAAVGAPHRRDRVFIIAHANSERREELDSPALAARAGLVGRDGNSGSVPDPEGERRGKRRKRGIAGAGTGQKDAATMDDAAGISQGRDGGRHASKEGEGRLSIFGVGRGGLWGEWSAEPDVGRVADGVPARVDRLRGLGNAVVPQVAEFIARRLMECIR